jgi:hypothetical protein
MAANLGIDTHLHALRHHSATELSRAALTCAPWQAGSAPRAAEQPRSRSTPPGSLAPTPKQPTSPLPASPAARGVARPLMAGYDPVPIHHRGRWWHIPADAAPDAPYVPATAEQHQIFDDLAQRLALGDAAVAADAERSS